jgi:hypothetical protein
MKPAFLDATANRVVTERAIASLAGFAKAGRFSGFGLDSSVGLQRFSRSATAKIGRRR